MSALKKSWPTTHKAEAYWRDIAAGFMHAPDESYLNTGSWGVLHRSVFDALVKGLEELEGNPTRNRARLVDRLNQARRDLGAFINAAPADLAFTTNVTIAINQVVHGLDWQPGDEILASDQEYGAIDNCLYHAERRYGVVVRRAPISIPPAEPRANRGLFPPGADRTDAAVIGQPRDVAFWAHHPDQRAGRAGTRPRRDDCR